MSGRIQDLTLTEIGARLGRYRPVVATVAVVLGVLVMLPDTGSGEDTLVAAPSPVAVGVPLTSAEDSPAPTPAPPTPSTPTTTTTRPALRPAAVATRPAPPTPPPSTPTTTQPVSTTTTTTTAPKPTVGRSGWAESGRDPLAAEVPEGTLPVATRLGGTAAVSFLELVGPWQTLELTVDESGASGVGTPTVRACAITTAGWQPGPGQDLADAPSWSDSCVDGIADGTTWRFAVSQIDHPYGVALVPGADAPVESRITFIEP